MIGLSRFVAKTLSLRISLMVVCAISALLAAALIVMLHYSWVTVKGEAIAKANQTLDATMEHVDNILLNVEQTAGNIYWDMLSHLHDPQMMFTYSSKLVETNRYITGAAIAFEPGYFKEQGQLFMAYCHREMPYSKGAADSRIIKSQAFGTSPYTEQSWYRLPVDSGRPFWTNPLKNGDTETEAIITFSLPFYDRGGKIIGVMAVDLSLLLFSEIVLSAKPSPNSYATLLGSDGSYIVHPDSNKITHHSIFSVERKSLDPTVYEAVKAMMAGEVGYKKLKIDGRESYVFYKPFQRASLPIRIQQDLGWSMGVVYPKSDIFSDFYRLLYIVTAIAVVSLVVLLLLCRFITHRQLLPLRMLTTQAQRIADGHYDDTIPDSSQHDEVGRLQEHFGQMQQALARQIGQLKLLTATLQERGQVLDEANRQAMEADRMKTAFLHNMTNHMVAPIGSISESIDKLSGNPSQEDFNREVDSIGRQSKTITEILNDLLKLSMK